MKFLTDANVLSEAMKAKPSQKVMAWLQSNERGLAIDPIILGEIRFGILLLPQGKKRRRLERWFAQGASKLTCIPWEADIGLCWAHLLADLRRAGREMPIKDSMIAATALARDLTLATRNERDFKKAGVKIINPFDE